MSLCVIKPLSESRTHVCFLCSVHLPAIILPPFSLSQAVRWEPHTHVHTHVVCLSEWTHCCCEPLHVLSSGMVHPLLLPDWLFTQRLTLCLLPTLTPPLMLLSFLVDILLTVPLFLCFFLFFFLSFSFFYKQGKFNKIKFVPVFKKYLCIFNA